MEYKFAFEDGSESLMHYGKRGMKWGVWNNETKRRYIGTLKNPSVRKANAKYLAKTVANEAVILGLGAGAGALAGIASGGNPIAKRAVSSATSVALRRGFSKAKNISKQKRLAEIEQAKINEGKAKTKQLLDKSATQKQSSSLTTTEPKWKRNGYSSEAEHKAAIAAAIKMLEGDGGKVVSTYYDTPKQKPNQKNR